MLTEVQNRKEESTGSLLGGIVDDFRDLIKQELHLARQEIKDDLKKTREAGLLWSLGAGLLGLGGVIFCMMLAHLLHTMTAPSGSDPASLPMWACYGIVCLVLMIAGGLVASAGQKKFDSIHLIDKQLNQVEKEIT